MTAVDLVVLGVMFVSGLIGFTRGLVREVLTIAAWVGAAVIAIMFVRTLNPWLNPYMPSPEWTDPAGYVLLFLVSLIVLSLIAKTIGGAVRSSAIGGIDRTLGLVFGLARGAALAVAAYIIAGMVHPPEQWPEQVLAARSLPYIYKGAAWVARVLPPEYPLKVDPPPPSRQSAGGDNNRLFVGTSDRPTQSQVTGILPHG